MGVTIGLIAIKGGVGKTTVSAALAADLANNYKKRVLLVDANYSAPNLGVHMDILEPVKTVHDVLSGKSRMISAIHTRHGVDVVPGSMTYDKGFDCLKLKDRIASVKDSYDYIILDSSPSLNDEILSTMVASDLLFVVTTPDFATLSCSLKAAKLARHRGRPIAGIIVNKIRDPKYEITLKEIEEFTEIPVVAMIKDDKASGRALFSKMPVSLYDSGSGFSREVNRLGASITNIRRRRSIGEFISDTVRMNLKPEEVNRALLKDSFYKNVFSN